MSEPKDKKQTADLCRAELACEKKEKGQEDEDGEEGPPISEPAKPTQWTEAELRLQDSKLQPFTEADWRLMSVYYDTVHHNDGTHLHGPISTEEDEL